MLSLLTRQENSDSVGVQGEFIGLVTQLLRNAEQNKVRHFKRIKYSEVFKKWHVDNKVLEKISHEKR